MLSNPPLQFSTEPQTVRAGRGLGDHHAPGGRWGGLAGGHNFPVSPLSNQCSSPDTRLPCALDRRAIINLPNYYFMKIQEASTLILKRMPFIIFRENTKGQPQKDSHPFLYKIRYIIPGRNSQKGSPRGNLYSKHMIRTQPRKNI